MSIVSDVSAGEFVIGSRQPIEEQKAPRVGSLTLTRVDNNQLADCRVFHLVGSVYIGGNKVCLCGGIWVNDCDRIIKHTTDAAIVGNLLMRT